MITAKHAKTISDDVCFQVDLMRKRIEQLIEESAKQGMYSCIFELRKSPYHATDKANAELIAKELQINGFKTSLCVDLEIFWS